MVLDEIRDELRDAFARDHAPSLSVAVGLGGEVVSAEALGFANVSEGRPADIDTAYLLASITKPIVATATCVLASRGVLELDAPIDRYLGGVIFPFDLEADLGAARPTIRQVLQHRGGFGTYWRPFYADEDPEPLSVPALVARYGHVFTSPGERFVYSNLGYGLLDEVIHNVTGVTTNEVVRAEVFDPCRMSSGWIGPTYGGPGSSATRYAMDGVPYPTYDVEHPAASLAWATAPDLVRFGLAHVSGSSPLDSAALRPMLDALHDDQTDALGYAYGLGWVVKEAAGIGIVSHRGAMSGVSTLLAVVPDEQLAIAALTNVTNSTLPQEVASLLMGKLMPRAASELEGYWREQPPQRRPLLDGALADLLGTWRGAIRTEDGDTAVEIEIRADGMFTGSIAGSDPAKAVVGTDPAWDLTLTMPRSVALPDPLDRTDATVLSLDLRGEELTGTALAIDLSENDRGRRVGNALCYRCRLRRAPR